MRNLRWYFVVVFICVASVACDALQIERRTSAVTMGDSAQTVTPTHSVSSVDGRIQATPPTPTQADSGRERARRKLAARHEKEFRRFDKWVAEDLWGSQEPWMYYDEFSDLVVDACKVLKRYDYNLLFATDLRNDTLENTAARVVWSHAGFGGLNEAYCDWHKSGPEALPISTPGPWLYPPTPTPRFPAYIKADFKPCGNSDAPECGFDTIHIGTTLHLKVHMARLSGTLEREDLQGAPFCPNSMFRSPDRIEEGANVVGMQFRTCEEGVAVFHLRRADGLEGSYKVVVIPR